MVESSRSLPPSPYTSLGQCSMLRGQWPNWKLVHRRDLVNLVDQSPFKIPV